MTAGNQGQLFFGIDGGGSKTKAVIMSQDNQVLGWGISGPANPLHGYAQAVNSIVESAKLALKHANLAHRPLHQVIAGVGLAGVNLPMLFDQMSAWQHPFKQIFLASDLLIACQGAHQGADGAVVIVGTGSSAFSYVNGVSKMFGGHGFPLGDQGSGAWFGLQAVTQILLSLDGLSDTSSMAQQVLSYLQCDSACQLAQVSAGQSSAFYARLAIFVFDAAQQGDAAASLIVHQGANYINDIVRQLDKSSAQRISLVGGLASRLKPWLASDIQQKLLAPLTSPEVGAAVYAQQQMALSGSSEFISCPVAR